MKCALLLFLLLCQASGIFAQKTYIVTGFFKSKYQGKVYLNHGSEVDSVYSNDGKFVFKGELRSLPEYSFVSVESKLQQGLAPFYIEGGSVSLEVDTLTKVLRTSKGERKSLMINVKVDKQSRTDKLIDSVSSLISESVKGITDAEVKNAEIQRHVLIFLSSKPNTIASAVILVNNVSSFSKEQAQDIYHELTEEIKRSEPGKRVFGYTIKQVPVVINEKIPDFAQTDVNGKVLSIQSLRGKYVLIDFWASWCLPCRQENPSVLAAYRKFKSKEFEILGISLDSEKENWLKAINTDQLSWLHVSDLNGWNNAVSKMFNIKSIPDNFLIDPNGKVLARGLRGEALEKRLAQIFLENKVE